jgi:hemerythrin
MPFDRSVKERCHADDADRLFDYAVEHARCVPCPVKGARMALLSWSDQYLIGNATIDAEHKELFRLINDFHTGWNERRQPTEIAALLNRLVQYAQLHFQHEEAIMADAGYPRLAEHHAVHEQLFDTIFKLHQEQMEHDRHLEQDTLKFVRSWLVEHIVNRDYDFRDFLARPPAANDQTAKP